MYIVSKKFNFCNMCSVFLVFNVFINLYNSDIAIIMNSLSFIIVYSIAFKIIYITIAIKLSIDYTFLS